MKKYNEEKNYYNIIRKNICKFRKEKGFSQKTLANKIGYSENYLKEIESFEKNKTFSIIVLGRIADVLEIDIKKFFEV